ncbi:hypothetical protein B4U80_13892 [Leptotrombidium deliense]|uniref:Uncharacterized protein n=1 Tax=Leptotrombidium deliense TaxID=299467 RepID=A0A443S8W8_9ACAR|nr:hypothetical protein B4U80_13892 [Leptotrombidium deliense]
MTIRQKLFELTSSDELEFCSAKCIGCQVNYGPFAEYPIASFGTCCNMSSVANALAFFAKNRRNLSIFVHPTTIHALLDHTERGVWIGPSMPLDTSKTAVFP